MISILLFEITHTVGSTNLYISLIHCNLLKIYNYFWTNYTEFYYLSVIFKVKTLSGINDWLIESEEWYFDHT